MHVPDGFLDAPTSVATGVIAVAGVAVALRGARHELDYRTAPLAVLVATFVFAGQMINFPVAGGTSGHLRGGVLAAVLAGPYTAVLCISVVLLVQALLMADGGITALGTNITLMALVGVVAGWLVFAGVWAVLPKRVSSRSEEHTSELQSLMRISYAVFCLKKKKNNTRPKHKSDHKIKTT